MMKCSGLTALKKFSKLLIAQQMYKALFQKFGKKPTFFSRWEIRCNHW